MRIVPAVRLVHHAAAVRSAAERRFTQTLPSRPWALSLDLRLRDGDRAALGVGRLSLVLRGRRGGLDIRLPDGAWRPAGRTTRSGWHHVEATPTAVTIDGAAVGSAGQGRTVTLVARHGAVDARALMFGRADDATGLLLQRLAAIRAQTPPGRFPLSTDLRGRLRFSSGWTSGFWAGALWQAAGLTRSSHVFTDWALQATLEHLGNEAADTHDLGFMYGRSSVEAYTRLCPDRAPAATCSRLRASGLRAARTLVQLADTNTPAGLIPMVSRGEEADTIIDSTMNLSLLTWATQVTGDDTYAAIAARHAHRAAALLVRPDGSTFQSVHVRRADGEVLFTHTHQGLSDTSVWSRGQSWAVYGFARTGLELRDRDLVAVAEHAARYVADHVPADGVPPYDYAAGPGAPKDVSAAAITAAGLFRLDRACRALPRSCREPARWAPLASRMLDGVLRHVSRGPALGALGSQVYSLHARPEWEHEAELVFGIDYALEAVALRRAST